MKYKSGPVSGLEHGPARYPAKLINPCFLIEQFKRTLLSSKVCRHRKKNSLEESKYNYVACYCNYFLVNFV